MKTKNMPRRLLTFKSAAILLLFWVPVLIFLKLAGGIVEKGPLPFDVPVLEWLHLHSTGFLDSFFLFATNAGGIISVILITAFLTMYFLYKQRKFDAVFLALGVVGSSIANLILKAVFHRDRPSIWHQIIVEHSFSFPSGHAMASAAFVTCLIVIFRHSSKRWLVIGLGVVAVVLIGLSRLYLGVHYPSDVLAGWSVSVLWVFVVYYLLKRLPRSSAHGVNAASWHREFDGF